MTDRAWRAPRRGANRRRRNSELPGQAGIAEIDPITAHQHAFGDEQPPLRFALWERAVGAHDTVPGEIVVGGEDAADEARRGRFDVAEGADVAFGDRADTLDDSLGARLAG